MFKSLSCFFCGCVGRVHNEVSTRDQRKEREKTHTDWKTDLNEGRSDRIEPGDIVVGSEGDKYIYDSNCTKEGLYQLDKQTMCQGNVVVGFVIFFTFLATSTSALP